VPLLHPRNQLQQAGQQGRQPLLEREAKKRPIFG
jgi:hypothetical protein